MQLACISMKTSYGLRGNINEVFILVDLGGAVRFFVFVSYLRLPDAGCIPAAQVYPWRMGCDCAGNHWFADQYQHGAFLLAGHVQRD